MSLSTHPARRECDGWRPRPGFTEAALFFGDKRSTLMAESRVPSPESRARQPSQAGNFFFTATFFSATYFGRPSLRS
ncbi:hypothetical protein J2Y70_001097 [Xanthomonas translucens]|nr:hypothetical protein [Xanthomonas translucens]